MSRFFVTFGQRYAREQHPTFGAAHPDGWFEIEAPDYGEARRLAIGWLGTAWSQMYGGDNWDWTYYPRGQLHFVTAEPAATP